jgi:hypothetical protein
LIQETQEVPASNGFLGSKSPETTQKLGASVVIQNSQPVQNSNKFEPSDFIQATRSWTGSGIPDPSVPLDESRAIADSSMLPETGPIVHSVIFDHSKSVAETRAWSASAKPGESHAWEHTRRIIDSAAIAKTLLRQTLELGSSLDFGVSLPLEQTGGIDQSIPFVSAGLRATAPLAGSNDLEGTLDFILAATDRGKVLIDATNKDTTTIVLGVVGALILLLLPLGVILGIVLRHAHDSSSSTTEVGGQELETEPTETSFEMEDNFDAIGFSNPVSMSGEGETDDPFVEMGSSGEESPFSLK